MWCSAKGLGHDLHLDFLCSNENLHLTWGLPRCEPLRHGGLRCVCSAPRCTEPCGREERQERQHEARGWYSVFTMMLLTRRWRLIGWCCLVVGFSFCGCWMELLCSCADCACHGPAGFVAGRCEWKCVLREANQHVCFAFDVLSCWFPSVCECEWGCQPVASCN
jgi:hypothetical protein